MAWSRPHAIILHLPKPAGAIHHLEVPRLGASSEELLCSSWKVGNSTGDDTLLHLHAQPLSCPASHTFWSALLCPQFLLACDTVPYKQGNKFCGTTRLSHRVFQQVDKFIRVKQAKDKPEASLHERVSPVVFYEPLLPPRAQVRGKQVNGSESHLPCRWGEETRIGG